MPKNTSMGGVIGEGFESIKENTWQGGAGKKCERPR